MTNFSLTSYASNFIALCISINLLINVNTQNQDFIRTKLLLKEIKMCGPIFPVGLKSALY